MLQKNPYPAAFRLSMIDPYKSKAGLEEPFSCRPGSVHVHVHSGGFCASAHF